MALWTFPSSLNSLINNSRIFYVDQYSGLCFNFPLNILFWTKGQKFERRKKGKNMTTPHTNYFVIIVGLFQTFLSEHENRNNNFFRAALLFSELFCCIPCNWKYIHLFLIGGWTTASWRICHQAFSVTIPGWSGCKFGVFLNICVRATHGIRPSKQPFECVGDIAYLGYILIKLH